MKANGFDTDVRKARVYERCCLRRCGRRLCGRGGGATTAVTTTREGGGSCGAKFACRGFQFVLTFSQMK